MIAKGFALEGGCASALVTVTSLLFVAIVQQAPATDIGSTMVIQTMGAFLGAPLGAWLARRLLARGRLLYASLLVLAAWVGLLLAAATLPSAPAAVWGGPLRRTPASIGWVALWILVPVFIATMARRSEPNRDLERAVGPFVGIGFGVLALLFLASAK